MVYHVTGRDARKKGGHDMIQLATERRKWTYQDYLQLDEGIVFEIIDGEQIVTPAPNWQHQDISEKLEFLMEQYIRQKQSGKLFHAPVDVVLAESTVVQPDILFISQQNLYILQKEHSGIMGVPDLVIEIVSPSSFYYDVHEKKDLYERFHIPEYWIIEPGSKTIEVLTLEDSKYKLYSLAAGKGQARSKVLDGFAVNVAEIIS
jgi:Uma2 family endonuclease